MVFITVYLVYVVSQEVFNIYLFVDVQTCRLDVSYYVSKFFLIWSFQKRIIRLQYIDDIYVAENTLVNLALPETDC